MVGGRNGDENIRIPTMLKHKESSVNKGLTAKCIFQKVTNYSFRVPFYSLFS